MKIPMRTGGVVVAVAVLTWTAARSSDGALRTSSPRAETTRAASPSASPVPPAFEPDVPRVVHVAFNGGSAEAGRNLFSYVEAPPAPPARVVERAPVALEAPKPAAIEVAVAREPEPPAFDYRYMGRFGRDAAPLAAFSRNGEVLVRRAGERIDPRFVLVRIGAESVDIAAEDGTQRVMRRVPIGD